MGAVVVVAANGATIRMQVAETQSPFLAALHVRHISNAKLYRIAPKCAEHHWMHGMPMPRRNIQHRARPKAVAAAVEGA